MTFESTGHADGGHEQTNPDDLSLIPDWDPLSVAYRDRFKLFVNHTDQKRHALERTVQLVSTLSHHDHFVDAGAGDGLFTVPLGSFFRRVTAIEPNASLFDELQRATQSAPRLNVKPRIDLSHSELMDSRLCRLRGRASFILCSHVFCYIDKSVWQPHLVTLLNWLRPGGMALVSLQSQTSDCMGMLRAFSSAEAIHSVSSIWDSLAQHPVRKRFVVETEAVPGYIRTDDESVAYDIAEWMFASTWRELTSPIEASGRPSRPTKEDVRHYVRKHFYQDGVFSFSCEQEFLIIRRPASHVT